MKSLVRYKVNPDYLCRKIAGEYIIVPTGEGNALSNALLTPNETAVFLWEKFQNFTTVSTVVRETMELYDIDEETLTSEIEHFISELLPLHIILREEEK